MKKISFIVVILLFAGFLGAQTNNVLLEYCTGTWCPYCPCGDAVAEGIQYVYPDALILAYHGPTNPSSGYEDPFRFFHGNEILSLYDMHTYPSGVVGRRTGVISRGSWAGQVDVQTSNYPSPISLSFNKTVDSVARTVNLTVIATALRDIDTNVNVNFVISEDNVIYSQAGNSSCPGSSTFVHNWLVRSIVNGAVGDTLSTGHWAAGTTKTRSWTTTLDAGWVWYNCKASVIAFFYNGTFSSLNSYVLNTKKIKVNTVTGVENLNNTVPAKYNLAQNYPNPFNPTTNIHFSIPQNGNVSLKIYDIIGNEVATYYDGFLKAGIYNAEFDGTKLSSGIYFYRLTAGNFSETKKMMLVK
jgi:hypothetical protein